MPYILPDRPRLASLAIVPGTASPPVPAQPRRWYRHSLAAGSGMVSPPAGFPCYGAAVATQRLRDERLAWLAVRDELNKRVYRRQLVATVFTLGMMPGLTRSWASRRMTRYGITADQLATHLSHGERQVLRASGQAPDWFLPAVLRGRRDRPTADLGPVQRS
jgi:hypothetical protein